MKIIVNAKAGAKREFVKSIDETHLAVSVKSRAVEGRANEAIIKAVAKYFKVPPSHVTMVRGHLSRTKILDIL